MTAEQREHLHANTAVMLDQVSEKTIKVRYLAQQHCISQSYARAIFDALKNKDFGFGEVEEMAKGAEKMTHTPRFLPSKETDRLVGRPAVGVYND